MDCILDSAPDISIIIPAYNVRQYVERCVDSLMSIHGANFEILIVDDGSTDGTSALCDALAEKDSRIRVFHQRNSGVSEARNTGLRQARGTWIGFVDADDRVESQSYERVLRYASHSNADMLMYGYRSLRSDQPAWVWNMPAGYLSVQSAIAMISAYSGAKGYLWNKLYRRSIIIKQELKCDSRISMCEDLLFNIEYVIHCSRIIGIAECAYDYMENPSSSLHNVNMDKAFTCVEAHERMLVVVPEESRRMIASSYAIMAEEFLMRTYRAKQTNHRSEYWHVLCLYWRNAIVQDIPLTLRIRLLLGRFMPSIFYTLWNFVRR